MIEREPIHRRVKVFEKYLVLLIIVILFMGIAYASISDVEFTLKGVLKASAQQGIFISDISKVSTTGVTYEEIKYYNGTTLSTSITLSSLQTSSLVYKIYIHNNSSEIYYFSGVEYDEYCYDNKNISFSLEGIEPYRTTIEPNETIDFNIAFKHQAAASASQTLNSMLNFKFNNEFIKFKVDGKSYTAPKGATWEQFINSEYNTYGFTLVDETVCGTEEKIILDSNNKIINKTDIISEDIQYVYETIEITLTRTSNANVTQGENATYAMNINTNGTLKTGSVQAKVVNLYNSEICDAFVSGNGKSYTIVVDTSLLKEGTYRIKISEGMIETENRY